MWHDDALKVNCTCVRVPIWRSHSESITIECENEVDVNEARELVSKAEGVLLKDDPKKSNLSNAKGYDKSRLSSCWKNS